MWEQCWLWVEMNRNLISGFVFYSIFPVTNLSSSCILRGVSLFVLCSSSLSSSTGWMSRAAIWFVFEGTPPFSGWFSGSAFGPPVMSLPALVLVALTSLQRRRQKKRGGGRRKQERESWTVVIRQLSNNMAAASEDD